MDDLDFASELSEKDDLANLIEDNYRKMKKKFDAKSTRSKNFDTSGIGLQSDTPNIFSGNRKHYDSTQELVL
jgi:hypothetical protein